jgi:hypothetical protein
VSTGVLALCLRASRSPPPLVTCLAENIRQRANTTGAPLAYVSPASDRQAIINELIVLFDGPAQREAKGLREMAISEWASELIEQCREVETAVFVKQLGPNARAASRPLPLRDRAKGAYPEEWPPELRVQEFPLSA